MDAILSFEEVERGMKKQFDHSAALCGATSRSLDKHVRSQICDNCCGEPVAMWCATVDLRQLLWNFRWPCGARRTTWCSARSATGRAWELFRVRLARSRPNQWLLQLTVGTGFSD
ncbi:hypothetical protein Q3G72_009815 [Acer saccharum]|nr:hypothetical protein Q3G72_009815 [Acer saccharum]